jgi:hypothetical protein
VEGGAQLGEERLVERPVRAAGGVQTQHRDGLDHPGIAVRSSVPATRFADVLCHSSPLTVPLSASGKRTPSAGHRDPVRPG